jgi:hypothetical protein
MPIPSSALETEQWLRVLFLGPPKLGKSTAAVCTSPAPVRVLLCEGDTALREPQRRGAKFDFERILSEGAYKQMTSMLLQAKEDAKAKLIKTVVIDPLSDFADRLLAESMKLNLTNDGNEDGRRAYPHYTKRLMHCIDLAFTIPAHLIVISHYYEVGGGELGLPKTGEGIVPLIPGQARARISARFNDVLWLDFDKATGDRMFVTGPQGAWGPGCRSLPNTTRLPADFTALIKTFAANGNTAPAKKTNGVAAAKPVVMQTKPPIPTQRRQG